MTTTATTDQDVTAAQLTDELETARRAAARAVERATAIADLRLRLLEMTNRTHRPVTLGDLFAEVEGRGERPLAELRALCHRITGDSFEPPATIQEE